MCLQKVRVRDYLSLSRYSYYNCGHCSACRQQVANSKVAKISSHHVPDCIRYFVTLGYDNDHIPVCSYNDLSAALDQYEIDFRDEYSPSRPLTYHNITLPIYRGIHSEEVIGYHTLKDFPIRPRRSEIPFVSLHFDPTNFDNNLYHDDYFSISYSPDVRNFFKRLRTNYFRQNGELLKLSYFYAPEYGPTTCRFHAHFVLWLPTRLSCDEVRELIIKAWPFQMGSFTWKNVDIALAPAHYVASYVNCDTNVPEFILKHFPLRQSHSLYFGFRAKRFSLSEVLSSFRQGHFGYDTTITRAKQNTCEIRHFYYSKSLLSRYFPKFKGFTRLNYVTLRNILTDPSQYLVPLWTSKKVAYEDQNLCREYFIEHCCRPVDYNINGDALYDTPIIDTHSRSVSFTLSEMHYLQNRINNTYDQYWRPLGYTRLDFAHIVIDYIFSRQRYMYRETLLNPETVNFNQIYNYDNIEDLDPSYYPTLLDYVSIAQPSDFDPSLNPLNVRLHNKYLEQYNSNIKQRQTSKLCQQTF